jgi:hypothetical protein
VLLCISESVDFDISRCNYLDKKVQKSSVDPKKCLHTTIHDQQTIIFRASVEEDFNSFPTHLILLEASAYTDGEKSAAACAFCNLEIPFGQSVCSDCMKKYDIRLYDLSSDGCGCDR